MYIAFDVETSGLDVNINNLLTACFIVLDSGLKEVNRLNISVKHEYYNLCPKAMEINKIDIRTHHKISTDLLTTRSNLINFLRKNKATFYLIPIGHNVAFDISFVKKLLGTEYHKYFSYNTVDTLGIANFLKLCGKIPQNQAVSLSSLVSYYGLETGTEHFHSAEYDTEMTVKLLKKFKELM